MIRSENARFSGYVYVDIRNTDLQSAVRAMQKAVLQQVKSALNRRLESGEPFTEALLLDAIREGAVLRVRPKAMTVAVVLAARSRLRSDATHCSAYGRWHDHCAAAFHARHTRRLVRAAAPLRKTGDKGALRYLPALKRPNARLAQAGLGRSVLSHSD